MIECAEAEKQHNVVGFVKHAMNLFLLKECALSSCQH